MGEAKRRKLLDANYGKKGLKKVSHNNFQSKTARKALVPDLGVHLISKGFTSPFHLQSFGMMSLGRDSVLGWMISGTTEMSVFSGIGDNPIPLATEKYMFSIYLGNIPETLAHRISERFRESGIPLVARPDQKYTAASGQDVVLPLKYLDSLT